MSMLHNMYMDLIHISEDGAWCAEDPAGRGGGGGGTPFVILAGLVWSCDLPGQVFVISSCFGGPSH